MLCMCVCVCVRRLPVCPSATPLCHCHSKDKFQTNVLNAVRVRCYAKLCPTNPTYPDYMFGCCRNSCSFSVTFESTTDSFPDSSSHHGWWFFEWKPILYSDEEWFALFREEKKKKKLRGTASRRECDAEIQLRKVIFCMRNGRNGRDECVCGVRWAANGGVYGDEGTDRWITWRQWPCAGKILLRKSDYVVMVGAEKIEKLHLWYFCQALWSTV